jgi:hypothetical protein
MSSRSKWTTSSRIVATACCFGTGRTTGKASVGPVARANPGQGCDAQARRTCSQASGQRREREGGLKCLAPHAPRPPRGLIFLFTGLAIRDMAGRGPAPKPAHLRQRTNQKAGHAVITAPQSPTVPAIPNPDAREWHPLTVQAWKHAWSSPMASQWIETDLDALGRLALLWDEFYQRPNANTLKEIRLQSALFGLAPLARSRLQWEVSRGEAAEQKQQRRHTTVRSGTDPRAVLMAVK